MVLIFVRKGRCERVLIDEVYLDLIDVVEMMLVDCFLEILEDMDEEFLKLYILGFGEVGLNVF